MQISQFFMNGDIKGAIAYMRDHEEFKDILPAYTAIFEDCEYRIYEIPDDLNDILRLYQIYFRDTFYCGIPEAEAADRLLAGLKKLLNIPDVDEALLTERLHAVFEAEGYHALFGRTQGYYGPYVWRDTVPTVYRVELPDGTAEYTVNILKGFVFRSWMDYLTFGRYGTGGWASPDGTINCVEQAYDFESERFLVSLLKHEAQHTVDMKQFPEITPAELEYRAKLVELHYSSDLGLLQKFLSEADESRAGDAHAAASAKIKREFAGTDQANLACIQTRALELFRAHTKEMVRKNESARGYSYIDLRQSPQLKDIAAEWFSEKWNIPVTAYLACMDDYLTGKTEYGWFLCLDGNQIVGGLGVIENDFHDRKDLTPNVCAVYTEKEYRCKGIAGRLLGMAVEDLRAKGISPVYLLTDHVGFYERNGWEFLCMVQGDGESEMSRMYVHK